MALKLVNHRAFDLRVPGWSTRPLAVAVNGSIPLSVMMNTRSKSERLGNDRENSCYYAWVAKK